MLARSEVVAAMKRALEELEESLRSLTSFTPTACGTGVISSNNFKLGLNVLTNHHERKGVERVNPTRQRGILRKQL